jgi:phosphoadenosine phosphosulfate reductase
VPVLFIDTEMQFAETLSISAGVPTWLSNVQVIGATARHPIIFERDNENLLHLHDDARALRKTEPLQRRLGFEG